MGTLNQPCHTLYELLSLPSLQSYVPAFKEAGYDDLELILSLSAVQLDSMIQSIILSGERLGIYIKHGHTIQILNKIRNQKNIRLQQQQTNNNIRSQPFMQPTIVSPPPIYTNQQPPILLQQSLNIRQLHAERERRRQLKLLQKSTINHNEPGIKQLPIEIDINKPLIDNGTEYVIMDITNEYNNNNRHRHHCCVMLNCYNIVTTNYCYYLLLFVVLLIVGIIIYITSSPQSSTQGLGTACIMFGILCAVLSIIQFTRRHIHRSKFIDSIECCSMCSNELDGVCASCTCGMCSCVCNDITCCTDTVSGCRVSCTNIRTDLSIWWSEFRAQFKSCCHSLGTCSCISSICNDCNNEFNCTDKQLCTDTECIDCSDCRVPNCTGPHSICAELGCAECSVDSCAGCCDEIECADCNCDCLPDCAGAQGCFNTCIKIVCCQCKIQIA